MGEHANETSAPQPLVAALRSLAEQCTRQAPTPRPSCAAIPATKHTHEHRQGWGSTRRARMTHLVQVELEHVALREAIQWLLCARLACCILLATHGAVSIPASRARPEGFWALIGAEGILARRAGRPKLAVCVHLQVQWAQLHVRMWAPYIPYQLCRLALVVGFAGDVGEPPLHHLLNSRAEDDAGVSPSASDSMHLCDAVCSRFHLARRAERVHVRVAIRAEDTVLPGARAAKPISSPRGCNWALRVPGATLPVALPRLQPPLHVHLERVL